MSGKPAARLGDAVACPKCGSTALVQGSADVTYDGLDHGQGAPSYWHIHTLGAIVTACLDAGLRLQRLEEHPHSNREADYDGYIGQTAQLPMSFTLVAQRPTA